MRQGAKGGKTTPLRQSLAIERLNDDERVSARPTTPMMSESSLHVHRDVDSQGVDALVVVAVVRIALVRVRCTGLITHG
jgi:hypothetical protein